MRRLGLGLTFAAATACATIGPAFDTSHLADLKAGLPAGSVGKADVERWFGEPHQVSTPLPHETVAPGPGGRACALRWHYAWAEAEAGGAARGEVLAIDFDAEGRLCRLHHDAIR